LIKTIILEEIFKWHLEAFASELFKYSVSQSQAKMPNKKSVPLNIRCP